jgi:hypothetical protein
VSAPISPGKNLLVCTSLALRKERVGHVERDSDGPGPGSPRVSSLALALAHSDGPGLGTPRVSSVAVVFAEAMGRFYDFAAANSRAGADSVGDQHAERTAVCLTATHGRVAHSF